MERRAERPAFRRVAQAALTKAFAVRGIQKDRQPTFQSFADPQEETMTIGQLLYRVWSANENVFGVFLDFWVSNTFNPRRDPPWRALRPLPAPRCGYAME